MIPTSVAFARRVDLAMGRERHDSLLGPAFGRRQLAILGRQHAVMGESFGKVLDFSFDIRSNILVLARVRISSPGMRWKSQMNENR